MGIFSSRKEEAAQPAAEPVVIPTRTPQRKDQATPTRRQAEAARRERLNPTITQKESKRRERDARAQARAKQYQSVEDAPERQLLRDLIDSRFNLGEIAMPLMFLLLIISMMPGIASSGYVSYLLIAMYAMLAYLVIDTTIVWRKFKALAAHRLPGRPLKGLLMYTFNRQLSIRRWRQPKPRVKRGGTI